MDGNVEKGWLGVSWVGEGTVSHFHQGFSLRLDTLNWTWLRELELHLGSGQGEVRAGGWVDLDVLVKVSLVGAELQVIERKNVGTAVIQKTGIVTDNDGCNIGKGVEVGLYPGNVDDI